MIIRSLLYDLNLIMSKSIYRIISVSIYFSKRDLFILILTVYAYIQIKSTMIIKSAHPFKILYYPHVAENNKLK